jgi:hypothetical protein
MKEVCRYVSILGTVFQNLVQYVTCCRLAIIVKHRIMVSA